MAAVKKSTILLCISIPEIVGKGEIFPSIARKGWSTRDVQINIERTQRINTSKKRRKKREEEKRINVLAIVLGVFAVIGAIEEFAVEKLDGNNSENEMEEHVNDQDIEDVLQ